MLTKEEAIKIIRLFPCTYVYTERCQQCKDTTALLNRISDILEGLTEKPKREIKVGDIYKNGYDNYETVEDVDVSGEFFSTEEGFDYDFNGIFLQDLDEDEETKARHSLDLSKKYKIVEDTDAD